MRRRLGMELRRVFLGGSPWVRITQTSAIAECKEVGAHLCTSQEILTISRDIEQQAVNWQGGVVGTGCLYGGHMDNHPASALATSTDDDAYSGTENTAGEAVVCPFDTTDGKKASKRTFTYQMEKLFGIGQGMLLNG